jgi:hypothetical protein
MTPDEVAEKQLDAEGWSRKQYNVKIPPAQPSVYDVAMDPKKLEEMKPLPGAAFPS